MRFLELGIGFGCSMPCLFIPTCSRSHSIYARLMNATWTARPLDGTGSLALSSRPAPTTCYPHSFNRLIHCVGRFTLNSHTHTHTHTLHFPSRAQNLLTKRFSLSLSIPDTDVALDVPVPSEEEERNMKRKYRENSRTCTEQYPLIAIDAD